jgi:hypothetical protein
MANVAIFLKIRRSGSYRAIIRVGAAGNHEKRLAKAVCFGLLAALSGGAASAPGKVGALAPFLPFGRALGRGRFGPGNTGASPPFPLLGRAQGRGLLKAPGTVHAQRVKKSRPISRVLSWTVIPLAYASPRSSSDLPGSPCGPHVAAIKPLASLFGLAPGGVCRAVGVATRAVRSYRTISPLPAPLARHVGGIFLLHFP